MNKEIKYNTILPPFKWFVLENFPYIEEDFDALTNWQLFCKLGKEMNKVIEKVNLEGEQVERLTNAFNVLKEYVDNYFENLDVQEEIDNKLDEMVLDGTLQEIIAEYLNSKALFVYDNVASMKNATNLINGSYAKTLGYYAKNDGGMATYKIRTITNDDVVDESFIIAMQDNTLVAELVYNDAIYVNQLGADNTGTNDASTKINLAMQKVNDLWLEGEKVNTIIFEGTYRIDNKINVPPCAKLTNSGFVKFISNVVNDSCLHIHYLSEDLPEYAIEKQQYLNGEIINFEKGCEIAFSGDKTTDNATAIEIGDRTNLGTDYPISRYTISNLEILNFTTGILHNNYNVYIGNYNNITLELNTTNIKFGLYSQIATASNAGERITFNECVIGPSSVGVLFDGVNWETFYDNCSFDFCQTVFKQTTRDQNYWNKMYISNSHFEGFNALAENLGINEEVININNSDIYNSTNANPLFVNCTVNKMIMNTLLHDKQINSLDPETFVSLDENVFLFNTLSPRSTQTNRYFIKNNMVNSFDGLTDGNVNVTTGNYVGDFKVTGITNFNSTAQIVTDNYLYSGHKSLLLTKSSANNATLQMETDLKPLTNQTFMITAPFIYNTHTSQQMRTMIEFYDCNDNLVKAKTSFEWLPIAPQKNTWSINPYGFFDNVPSNATQYKIKLNVPNFGPNDEIGTQYKIGGIIVNSR